MSHYLSMVAGVPLGDVVVNDVQAVNISGHECLTASLWITGVDGTCLHMLQFDKLSNCLGKCLWCMIMFGLIGAPLLNVTHSFS